MSPPNITSKLQLSVGVVKKVELVRAFFSLAQAASRSSHDLNLYVAINHMQDAVEIFLFALAEQLGVSLKEKGGFDGYFDQINAKTGKELPFRARLNAMNKTRVNSKHYAVQPDRKEVAGFVTVVGEFFEEVSRTLLGIEYTRISLVHLIANEKVRQNLVDATEAFLEGRYDDVLIEARKAFHYEFQSAYDISSFVNVRAADRSPWVGWFCHAPFFARNAEYIEREVKDPTDFIVLDHSRIDAELSKRGINHTTYWNVWRLTPKVFFDKMREKWIVRRDARIFDGDGIRDRAEYVLHSTIDLCLVTQREREAILSGPLTAWTIRLRQSGSSLYEKADRNSPAQPLPDGISELTAYSWVTGFDGGVYWEVRLENPWRSGYVSNDDIVE